MNLDRVDARLLEALQQQIPLEAEPFAVIARRLEMDPADVLRRTAALSAPPTHLIRQVSAIFDSATLGYRSCLVAARVDESRLDAAAAGINEHPGVSHNYRRNHAYNLWFTLAVPPDSALGLERTLEILQQRSGADAMRPMPSLKLYKIGVKFDLSGDGDVAARSERAAESAPVRAQETFVAAETDQRMIRSLQQNLPLVERPFDVLAEQAGVSTSKLLAAAQRYLDLGVMRRFAAVLRHRQAGFGANAMGVWIVPPDRADDFGPVAASFDAVSHCYRRPTYEDWPYSVFTMVHAQTREGCEAVLTQIARTTGVGDYAALYSTHEYKKVRLKYFTPDIKQWEASAAGLPENENPPA